MPIISENFKDSVLKTKQEMKKFKPIIKKYENIDFTGTTSESKTHVHFINEQQREIKNIQEKAYKMKHKYQVYIVRLVILFTILAYCISIDQLLMVFFVAVVIILIS